MSTDETEGPFYEYVIDLNVVKRDEVLNIEDRNTLPKFVAQKSEKSPNETPAKLKSHTDTVTANTPSQDEIEIRNHKEKCENIDSVDSALQKESIINQRVKVHRSWGHLVSDIIESDQLMALITFKTTVKLSDNNVKTCIKNIEKKIKKSGITALRWSEHNVLVTIANLDTYNALGAEIENDTLGLQIDKLCAACLCNPPLASLDLICAKDDNLTNSIIDIVLPFSGSFTYLNVFTDESQVIPEVSHMPSLGISILFTGPCQSHANKTLERLKQSPWQPLPLPSNIKSTLPCGLSYHLNSLGGPVWGIKTGCPQPGVQLLLLVHDVEHFTEMSEFYSRYMVAPEADVVKASGGVMYQIFPLSLRCELMMVYYPGITCTASNNLSLRINITSDKHSLLENATKVDDQHWTVRDPEGNLVTLAVVLQ